MEPDTTILARQTTAVVWPELTVTEQPAGATAQAAQGTPDESHPPAAAAALPEPAEPPDLDRLGDQIAELSARIDAATYELLCYLHQFNQQHGWEGFRSCAHWLNWRTGLDLGAAREKLRVATALAELPHISAAMACGRLSYSKVRALSRVASPATEARLLAVACGGRGAHDCATACRCPGAGGRECAGRRLDPGNCGDRFQVTVHVPADTLAAREPASTPPRLSAEIARQTGVGGSM